MHVCTIYCNNKKYVANVLVKKLLKPLSTKTNSKADIQYCTELLSSLVQEKRLIFHIHHTEFRNSAFCNFLKCAAFVHPYHSDNKLAERK